MERKEPATLKESDKIPAASSGNQDPIPPLWAESQPHLYVAVFNSGKLLSWKIIVTVYLVFALDHLLSLFPAIGRFYPLQHLKS